MEQTVQTEPLETIDDVACAPKHIPLETLKELRAKRLTCTQIGKIVGCSKQAVWWRLHGHDIESEDVDEYKSQRSDLLASTQLRLLSSLTRDDIVKMPAYQRIVAASILYDKERLETGKATSIHAGFDLVLHRIEQKRGKQDEPGTYVVPVEVKQP